MSPQPRRARQQADAIREAGAPADADVEAGLPDAEQQAAAAEQSKQREPRYHASRLVSNPTILGQSAAVVALAFHDAGIEDDAELTRAEAESLIADSLSREVRNEVEV